MAEATILLVDDNPVNLSVLRALLAREGYELVGADSGQAALDLVRTNPGFDLVLLDVSMPDVNGIEVCRALKADPSTEHIPIVLVSAVRTDDATIKKGLEVGAEGYLTKPIDDLTLRAWVRATLRISRLERAVSHPGESNGLSRTEVMAHFANLSHAVNNPLQALYANAELLGLELGGSGRSRMLVEEILSHTERVAELVTSASLLAKDKLK
jgi:CheY-like chemotaxis protein